MTQPDFDPWTLDSCELWCLEPSGETSRLMMLCRHRADGVLRQAALSFEDVTQFTPPHPTGGLCEVEANEGRWSEIGDSFACEFSDVDVLEPTARWVELRERLTHAILLTDRATPGTSSSGRGVVQSVTGWTHPDLALVDRLGPCAVEIVLRAESGDTLRLTLGGVTELSLPPRSSAGVEWRCESTAPRGWSTIDGTFVVDGRAWFHFASLRTHRRREEAIE